MSDVVIEGIEVVIERDLLKHRGLLTAAKNDLDAFKTSRSHQVKMKRHYNSLIGGGKFRDDSLRESIEQMNVNIRHLSDKILISEKAIEHHTTIVDTLTEQLNDQNKALVSLADYRRKHGLLN